MYQIKVIFSSNKWKWFETEYGTGIPATWNTESEAREVADKRSKIYDCKYKVVKV